MYASGLASDEEVSKVETAMHNSPEIFTAVEACLHDMESYVLLQAVPPPPALRAVVLNADLEAVPVTADDGEGYTNGHYHAQNGHTQIITREDLRPVRNNAWMYAAAAVFLLLLGSVALNFIYIHRYNDAMNAQKSQLLQLADADNGMRVMQTKLTTMESEMDLLQDPAMQVVKLAGTPAHSGMMAVVYWNPATNAVYFNGNKLPAPAAGKQYQLWAIVDGKPVDAGMFNSNQHSVQQMKAIANAQLFAITLENAGGSPTPTLDQMFVAGKVST